MNPTPTDTQAAQQRVLSIWKKAKEADDRHARENAIKHIHSGIAGYREVPLKKLSPCPTTAPGTSPAKPKEVIRLHLPGRKKAE